MTLDPTRTASGFNLAHFQESDRVNQDPHHAANFYLPDETYQMVLDRIVLTCVDLVLTYRTSVLLVQRNRYPRIGWWMIGGRIFPGETPPQSAQRILQGDVMLDGSPFAVEGDRIHFFGVYSTCFAQRSDTTDPNGTHSGSHTVNLTCCIQLNDRERQQSLTFRRSEYDYGTWVEGDRVPELLNFENEIDRCLLKVITDLRQTRLKNYA